MNKNIHKLLSITKKGLLALALTGFSGAAFGQATYTFNYSGAMQSQLLPAGSYSVAMWGADGGAATNGPGGTGGYSQGSFTVTVPTTYYVFVGGAGSTGAAGTAGGFNGGGTLVGSFTSPTVCGSGGGGTDIRTTANTTYANRIIVAGGGGGGTGYSNYTGAGGNGGGVNGADGTSSRGQTYAGGGATAVSGGTSATGGIASYSQPGALGIGGDYTGTLGGSAGGGGYYGGGSGHWGGAGGGGSGYVGGVSNGVTAQVGQPGFVAKPIVTGNGLVLITELCNISLVASGANPSNPVICSGQSLTLTTDAISNYAWSTGATSSSLVVAPTTNTVYSLTATSPSNCSASKSISVTVSSGQPTLSVITSTNQTCLGKTATLTASGAVNYTWTNGVTNGVSFFPSATQTYTVTGDNGCGTVQAVSTISVAPLAISVVSSGTAVCANKTATLTASAAATSYTWNPGNITGASPNLIVNPQANTIYTITATDGTCVGVTNISLQSNPVPTITSSSSASLICAGGTINLSATGGINYTWTPVNLNGSSITVSPTASTLYNVQGDNGFGCYGSSSQVIVVGTQPTVGVVSNISTICNGGSATLTASGANSYIWTAGPTTNTYVVSPTQATTYSVIGTNSASGCTDVKTISINVFSPSLAVSGNTVICNGASSNLSATGGVTYTWEPGGLPFQAISVSPSSNSVYTVSGIANQGALNCPVSQTIEVVVNPTPTITTTSVKPAVCAKETNTLNASGASTFTWTSSSTVIVSPFITVTATSATVISYTVTGVNAQGCESSANLVTNISACTGIETSYENNSNINIYPNPATSHFVIKGGSASSLHLTNELGQEIMNVELNEKNDFAVEVRNLSNGIYFVVGQNYARKVVINH